MVSLAQRPQREVKRQFLTPGGYTLIVESTEQALTPNGNVAYLIKLAVAQSSNALTVGGKYVHVIGVWPVAVAFANLRAFVKSAADAFGRPFGEDELIDTKFAENVIARNGARGLLVSCRVHEKTNAKGDKVTVVSFTGGIHQTDQQLKVRRHILDAEDAAAEGKTVEAPAGVQVAMDHMLEHSLFESGCEDCRRLFVTKVEIVSTWNLP